MRRIAESIDAVNSVIGRAIAWVALVMVILQLAVVAGRYVFGVGWIQVQETILYGHAFLFLLAAAYTLRAEGHVRVDIFYRTAAPRTKALINLVGVLVLLLPVAVLILWVSWGYVGRSWAVFERSKEQSGLPFVYLLKTGILAFGFQMVLQGISMALHSILALRGDTDELAALAPPPAST